MNKKEKLIRFVKMNGTPVGKNYSWLDLAIKFNIKPGYTETQRRKAANDIWRRHLQKYGRVDILDFSNTPTLETISPYQKPNLKEDGMYLILGCVHAPFVNLDFWKAMLQLASYYKDIIKGVVLAGDFLDLNSLSSHDRGKLSPLPKINLGWEYQESIKYINSLEEILDKDIYKAYIYGNHEDRYKRYLSNIDNSKLGSGLKSPEEGLQLLNKGFEVFTNWKHDKVKLGDLAIYHGESCAKHACHAELQIEKQSVLFFHTHRVQTYIEKKVQAYNAGSMADFNSPVFNYATKSMKYTWKNAFAIANLYEGKTSVDIVQWHENHFNYGGNTYT